MGHVMRVEIPAPELLTRISSFPPVSFLTASTACLIESSSVTSRGMISRPSSLRC